MPRNIFALLLAGACGLGLPAAAQSPGVVSVWFAADRTAVANGLADLCGALNTTVVRRDSSSVVCTRDVSREVGTAVQAGGNAYSTSSGLVLHFALREDRAAARVDAMQYIAVQSAHVIGPGQQSPVLYPKQRRALIDALVALGGSVTRPAKS